ncbi:MAG: flagellar basal body P-ring formation chaperone FlgA [Cellvibrionaceae bacterium]|nr:flagellar basal body P-ring formation chaperone FlgA [Cellvibrionaceae bacterium]MCV6625674.1 flagellar basal body P-ring formation chaperone FlgA [Cellvibrionaceae bacterium]
MKLLRLSFVASFAIAALAPLASADTVREQVRAGVANFLQQKYAGYTEQGYERVDIRVNQLDSRLRLQACASPLNFEQNNFRGLSNQATVRVSCSGPKPWSLFLGARIEAYAKIPVAAQPLVRGQILGPGDIHSQVRLVRGNQALLQTEQLLGLQLKRALPQGEPLRESHLTQPKLIKRGDAVVLAARLGAASVSTEATAMADGKLGQQIRVKNNRSKQVVHARVVAAGKVEVVL